MVKILIVNLYPRTPHDVYLLPYLQEIKVFNRIWKAHLENKVILYITIFDIIKHRKAPIELFDKHEWYEKHSQNLTTSHVTFRMGMGWVGALRRENNFPRFYSKRDLIGPFERVHLHFIWWVTFVFTFQCDKQHQKLPFKWWVESIIIFQPNLKIKSHSLRNWNIIENFELLTLFSPNWEPSNSSFCTLIQILPFNPYSSSLSPIMILKSKSPKCPTSMKLASGS